MDGDLGARENCSGNAAVDISLSTSSTDSISLSGGSVGSAAGAPGGGLKNRRKPSMLAVSADSEKKPSGEFSDSGNFRQRHININGRGLSVDMRNDSQAMDQGTSSGATDVKTFDLSPDEFEIMETIGHGSSSYVRKVLHKPRNRIMALKCINVWDKDLRKQIMTEIETLHDSKSRYLIPFYGAFYHEGVISIALDFASAGALSDIIRIGGPMPEVMLAFVTEQILLGLKFMHKSKHAVHRDFKPSNLLLDHGGSVLLTDFGVSSSLQNSEALCGTWVGTYLYMSPERFQTKPYSYPSDVWSLGLIVMECALGHFPLDGSRHGYWDVMMRMVQDAPPTLPASGGYSADIRDFIAKCLVKEPEDRSSVPELLEHTWIQRNCGGLTDEEKRSAIAEYLGTLRSCFLTMKPSKDASTVIRDFFITWNSYFEVHRPKLWSLYLEDSELSLNDETYVGDIAIMEALMSLEVKFQTAEDAAMSCSCVDTGDGVSGSSFGTVTGAALQGAKFQVTVELKGDPSKEAYWIKRQAITITTNE